MSSKHGNYLFRIKKAIFYQLLEVLIFCWPTKIKYHHILNKNVWNELNNTGYDELIVCLAQISFNTTNHSHCFCVSLAKQLVLPSVIEHLSFLGYLLYPIFRYDTHMFHHFFCFISAWPSWPLLHAPSLAFPWSSNFSALVAWRLDDGTNRLADPPFAAHQAPVACHQAAPIC